MVETGSNIERRLDQIIQRITNKCKEQLDIGPEMIHRYEAVNMLTDIREELRELVKDIK